MNQIVAPLAVMAERLDKRDCTICFPFVEIKKTIAQARGDLLVKDPHPLPDNDLASRHLVVVLLNEICVRRHLFISSARRLSFCAGGTSSSSCFVMAFRFFVRLMCTSAAAAFFMPP